MKSEQEITEFLNDFSKECIKTQVKTFKKGEIITTYLVNRSQICFLLNGNADLIRYESNGTQSIMEHISKNDIFGEVFYQLTLNNELFVLAKKDCTVLFFPYNFFKNKCKKTCKFHEKLSKTLPELILKKSLSLNIRIEVLSQRSIRDKLLKYFNIISARSLNKSFELTLSLTDLADYICVDRSAMMRELKFLEEDKIIKRNKKRITLLV